MIMELLEQLEDRINALLSQNDTLRLKSAELENAQTEALSTVAENTALREQLVQEQQKNTSALERLESILQRLKERTDNE